MPGPGVEEVAGAGHTGGYRGLATARAAMKRLEQAQDNPVASADPAGELAGAEDLVQPDRGKTRHPGR